ncbi:[Fe-S]-binding protein [Cephaloticoccus primus]|uniref:[Fe-S]-binding protein n=1 Tax=Cephaloticoccus primus TaxID=1548207 RepID=A0A139STX4_9BACT|nr:iron-sulfur cluster assembly accessory protein [Cephaloticoccus primus]KXU37891.1 [Fe-S]-binding protein [Cephaloticoccus primus]
MTAAAAATLASPAPPASVPAAAAVTAAAPHAPPVVPREGTEQLVRLTAEAGEKVRALIAREGKGEFLRIAISGGGCNGLSYKLRFVPEPRSGDILVRSAGVAVLVDSKTALYLRGTLLDYSSKLIAGGFRFTNPNAKASCSCGESFSV